MILRQTTKPAGFTYHGLSLDLLSEARHQTLVAACKAIREAVPFTPMQVVLVAPAQWRLRRSD